jgi:hypothetical protein
MTIPITASREDRLEDWLIGSVLGAADWIPFAGTPTFAALALLTPVLGGTPDALCAAAQAASPLSGMVPMYLAMSAVHAAPWLRLIARRVAADATTS